MDAVLEMANRWGPRWFDTELAVLWQSTLVVALVWVISALARRWPPAVRYWLWQIAAIKLLVMPLWTVALAVLPASDVVRNDTLSPDLAVQSTSENQQPTSSNQEQNEATPFPTDPSLSDEAGGEFKWQELTWQAWLLLAWLGVIAWQAVQLVVQRLRLRKILRGCQSLPGPALESVAKAAHALGLLHPPRSLVTSLDCSPFVCGLWRPTLVLNESLLVDLSPEQLRSVLLHELAHVKRHDLLWGWIPEIARRLYFFHPLAWYIAYRARLERELACDQMVLAHDGGTAAEYAETLVRVVTRGQVVAGG